MATFAQRIADTANDGASLPPNFGGYDPQNFAWGNLGPLLGGGTALAYGGVRFVSVTIPQGATIFSATLSIAGVGLPSTGTVIATLRGMAVDDAPALSQSSLTSGARTSASQPTPSGQSAFVFDVTAMVHEIVNRPGFASGNALAFVFDPTGADGYAFGNDYSNDPSNAASILVAYEAGSTPPDPMPSSVRANVMWCFG
jgi:hypothetical protein